jgi:hypothetical protein
VLKLPAAESWYWAPAARGVCVGSAEWVWYWDENTWTRLLATSLGAWYVIGGRYLCWSGDSYTLGVQELARPGQSRFFTGLALQQSSRTPWMLFRQDGLCEFRDEQFVIHQTQRWHHSTSVRDLQRRCVDDFLNQEDIWLSITAFLEATIHRGLLAGEPEVLMTVVLPVSWSRVWLLRDYRFVLLSQTGLRIMHCRKKRPQ